MQMTYSQRKPTLEETRTVLRSLIERLKDSVDGMADAQVALMKLMQLDCAENILDSDIDQTRLEEAFLFVVAVFYRFSSIKEMWLAMHDSDRRPWPVRRHCDDANCLGEFRLRQTDRAADKS
jgi:hypothetical protein